MTNRIDVILRGGRALKGVWHFELTLPMPGYPGEEEFKKIIGVSTEAFLSEVIADVAAAIRLDGATLTPGYCVLSASFGSVPEAAKEIACVLGERWTFVPDKDYEHLATREFTNAKGFWVFEASSRIDSEYLLRIYGVYLAVYPRGLRVDCWLEYGSDTWDFFFSYQGEIMPQSVIGALRKRGVTILIDGAEPSGTFDPISTHIDARAIAQELLSG